MDMDNPNRVLAMIARANRAIDEKTAAGLIDATKVEETRLKLDIDIGEYCTFQELKSLAHASGKITFDEAQTVYGLLGHGPDDFNALDCATKATLTKLFAELLNWKHRRLAA